MTIKRNQKAKDAVPTEAPVSVTPASGDHRQKVTEQIARLEHRHQELVQETARELEVLKQEISEGNDIQEQVAEAQRPLLNEISVLREHASKAEQEKQALAAELQRLRQEYQGHYSQLQGALGSLKHVVKNQVQTFDQQVRLFSVDTEQAIEELLASVDQPAERETATRAAQTVVEPTEPLPVVTDDNLEALLAEFSTDEKPVEVATPPVAEEVVQVVAEPIRQQPAEPAPIKAKKERKPRSFRGFRRFAVRLVTLSLVVAMGWGGLKAIQQHNLGADAAGQVAGVSTTAPTADTSGSQDSNQDHKEASAIVPFDQTEWTSFTEPNYGISIRYPKNATYLLETPGGSNIWFLRFDGYLMRITIQQTTDTFDAWWTKNSGFYTSDGTVTKGTFKNKPAYIVTPKDPSSTTGTSYLVQNSIGVLEIWVKDADPKTDDGMRLNKMVDSLSFSS